MSGKQWDWADEENQSDIVMPQMDAVAVYSNTKDDIVIRQRSYLGEDDHVIVVPKMFAQNLVDAIKAQMQD